MDNHNIGIKNDSSWIWGFSAPEAPWLVIICVVFSLHLSMRIRLHGYRHHPAQWLRYQPVSWRHSLSLPLSPEAPHLKIARMGLKLFSSSFSLSVPILLEVIPLHYIIYKIDLITISVEQREKGYFNCWSHELWLDWQELIKCLGNEVPGRVSAGSTCPTTTQTSSQSGP